MGLGLLEHSCSTGHALSMLPTVVVVVRVMGLLFLFYCAMMYGSDVSNILGAIGRYSRRDGVRSKRTRYGTMSCTAREEPAVYTHITMLSGPLE